MTVTFSHYSFWSYFFSDKLGLFVKVLLMLPKWYAYSLCQNSVVKALKAACRWVFTFSKSTPNSVTHSSTLEAKYPSLYLSDPKGAPKGCLPLVVIWAQLPPKISVDLFSALTFTISHYLVASEKYQKLGSSLHNFSHQYLILLKVFSALRSSAWVSSFEVSRLVFWSVILRPITINSIIVIPYTAIASRSLASCPLMAIFLLLQ